jgi:hypothetical protein
MKLRFSLALFSLLIISHSVFSQAKKRPLYNITIYKSVNDEQHKPDIFIEIDSAGNIFTQSGNIFSPKKKINQTIDIKTFTLEINKFVVREKLEKSPGSDFEEKIEAPTINLNEQFIEISIKFLDDFKKEKKLLNKTYYVWNEHMDKSVQDYPLYKYLTQNEIKILKLLLE